MEDKQICRLCLSASNKLSSIYGANKLQPANQPSLAMQIVSVVSLELFESDGMPKTICTGCRTLIENSYKFKQFCKKTDVLLKTFEITGIVPKPQDLPMELKAMLIKPAKTENCSTQTNPVKFAQKPKSIASAACQTEQDFQLEYLEEPEEEVEEELQFEIEIQPVEPVKPSPKTPKPIIVKKPEESIKILNKIPTPQRPAIAKVSYGAAPKQKILNNSKLLNKVYKEEFMIHQNENGNMEIITEDHIEAETTAKLEDSNQNSVKSAPIPSNVFSCEQCERSFPLKQQLVIHQENHIRERNFPCPTCDRAFFSKYDLGKHLFTHTGEKKYQCVICSKSFSRSTLLYRHEKIHVDSEKFPCTDCDRFYLDPNSLAKHMTTHKKNRPFSCGYCDKKFAFKQGLERHEIVHASDQPYKCQYCSLSYPSAGKLARHLIIHAGERPFPCKLCPKQFLLSHHLSRHLRSHQPHLVSTFQCSYCSMNFESKNEYYDHAAKHATETLSCPLCKMEFEDIDEVLEHVKHHTVNESHTCDYCDLVFLKEDQLEMHCINLHAKELCTVSDYKLQEGEEILEEFVIEEMEMRPVSAVKRKATEVQKTSPISKKQKVEEALEQIGWASDEQEILYDDEEEEEEEKPPTPPPAKKIFPKTPVLVKKEAKKLPVIQKAVTPPQLPKKSPVAAAAVQVKSSPPAKRILNTQSTQNMLTKLPKGISVSKNTSPPASKAIKLVNVETVKPPIKPQVKSPPKPQVAANPQVLAPEPSTSAVKSPKISPIAKPTQVQKVPQIKKPQPVAAKPTVQTTQTNQPKTKQKIERVKMTRAEIERLKAEGKIEYDKSGNMILKK